MWVVAHVLPKKGEMQRIEVVLRDDPVLIRYHAVAAAVFIDLVRIRADGLRSQLALIVVGVTRIDTMTIIEAMIAPSVRHMVDILRRKLTVFARGKWIAGR